MKKGKTFFLCLNISAKKLEEEFSTIAEGEQSSLLDKSVTSKTLYKGFLQEKNDWFNLYRELKQRNSKEQIVEHLKRLLVTFPPPVYNYPKPVRQQVYFAIRKLPFKYFLTYELIDYYNTKVKSLRKTKKKGAYKNYKKYFRRSSFSFNRRKSYFRRRSSYIPRRSSYRRSYTNRRYSRRYSRY